jgi:hypothetical protein
MYALAPSFLQIFPVKLTQDFIAIDVSGARFRGPTYTNKGGADTSIENNNVFAVQPTVYFDGMDPAEERATPLMQPNAKQVRAWVGGGATGAEAAGTDLFA